jgi:short-subunit dehydrogenase
MKSSPTVWITGASSGIGKAIAQAWSKRGARLLLSSRREDELHAVREQCAHPERHRVIPLDLAAPESLHAAVEEATNAHSSIDVLINNGGISQRATAHEADMAVVRRIMEVNFFGAVTLTKALLPHLIEQGHGHIGVVSSVVGKFSTANRTAYAASKHALHGYFDGLRAEVYDQGLRITLICPGYVQTDVTRNALTADGTAYGAVSDSIRNGMDPADCATAIIRALHEERDEIYPGGMETYMVYLKRFLPPHLFNRLIRLVNTT